MTVYSIPLALNVACYVSMSILNSCLIFYNTRVGSLGNHSFEKQTKYSNKIMLCVVNFYHSVLTLILVRMLIQQKYNYEPKIMRISFAVTELLEHVVESNVNQSTANQS